MIIFLCITSANINDFPIKEFDDMKMVNVKNSNNVIKYYKKGGIDVGSIKTLLNPSLNQLLLLSFDDDI